MLLQALLFASAASLAAGAMAQDPAGEPYTAPDYEDEASWLCRPGRQGDACDVDLTATVVNADGSTRIEPFTAATDPGIDCFYVYPTTSRDAAGNSDLEPDESEFRTVANQFARFREVCRPFAPLYRQVTIPALLGVMSGNGDLGADYAKAYRDVVAAFSHYLENDNAGRPFVLVGHSQGAWLLTQLLQQMIDGKPLQERMLSAILLGFNVEVPEGGDVGGALASVPLCRSPTQTGCVVAYVSFRDTIPPPDGARFGRVDAEGQQAACTNPADLAGTAPVPFDAYLRVGGFFGNGTLAGDWAEGVTVETEFVKVPGLFEGRCVVNDSGSYLQVTVRGDPDDPRTDDVRGDVYLEDGSVLPQWGLHLIDVGLTQGDLLELIRLQHKAFFGS